MLIGQVYIKDTHLILRDVDGSEESMPLSDALDLLDWLQQHKSEIEAKQQEQEATHASPALDWRDIEKQAELDLAAIETDQDAYRFMDKYLSKELRHQHLAIYRSDRHEMNRTPQQAIKNLLSLPPL